jgi:hypothetical protein
MKGMNMVFFILFIILLIVHSMFSVKSLQNEAMRNRFHMTISVTIFLLIIIRISIKVFVIFGIEILTIQSLTWKYYFTFQLPFDMLNIAIIAQFFQWLEVSYTLYHVIQLNSRAQKDKDLRSSSSGLLDMSDEKIEQMSQNSFPEIEFDKDD